MAKRKSFDDWTAQEVRMTFNIRQMPNSTLLSDWLAVVHPPSEQVAKVLEDKRAMLERFYRSWNEDELKFQFIAQIVDLADLHGNNFNLFSQRRLEAVVNDIPLQGKPEVMVATGQEDPIHPYFFIHEYKPTRQMGDPLGQVLSAMVAAQKLNADGLPLLGCFVIGAIWQFLVLENNTYSLSRTFDATQADDLRGIYAALCQAKSYIVERSRFEKT